MIPELILASGVGTFVCGAGGYFVWRASTGSRYGGDWRFGVHATAASAAAGLLLGLWIYVLGWRVGAERSFWSWG